MRSTILLSSREGFSKAWLILPLLLVGGYIVSQTDDLGPAPAKHTIRITAGPDGHFRVSCVANRAMFRNCLIDTGATGLVFPASDAARMGIRLRDLVWSGWASTANGRVRVASIRLKELSVGGGIIMRNVPVEITQGDMEGEALLGVAFLQRFKSYNVQGGTMTLVLD
jgi:aspartyl protease family protein